MINLITICIHQALGIIDKAIIQSVLPFFTMFSLALVIGKVRGFIFSMRCLGSTKRLYRSLASGAKQVNISELNGNPDESGFVFVFTDDNPRAFTMGWWKPQIYMSSSLIDTLTTEKLDIIIQHEKGHQARRDPLRHFALSLLSENLWFVPALKPLASNYQLKAEAVCDRKASQKGHSSLDVAKTLVSLAELQSSINRVGPAIVSSVDDILEKRVRHLMGENLRKLSHLSMRTVYTSILVLTLMLTTTFAVFYTYFDPSHLRTEIENIASACTTGHLDDPDLTLFGIKCPHCSAEQFLDLQSDSQVN